MVTFTFFHFIRLSNRLTGHLSGLPGQLAGHIGLQAGHQGKGDPQLVGDGEQDFSVLLGLAGMKLRSVHKHSDCGSAEVPLAGRILHPHFQSQRRGL